MIDWFGLVGGCMYVVSMGYSISHYIISFGQQEM